MTTFSPEFLTKELYNAVYYDKRDRAQTLIDLGAKPNEDTMVRAVAKLDVNWLNMLLDAGGKATSKMLGDAVKYGFRDKAEALIVHGAKPDDDTLIWTIANRDISWLNMLLDADGKATSKMLYDAVKYGFRDKAEKLIEKGAVPDEATLTLSMQNRDMDWTNMLLKAIKDSKKPSEKGPPPPRDPHLPTI